MLEVIGMHRDAALTVDSTPLPSYLVTAHKQVWDDALLFGRKFGYRNAQASLPGPHGYHRPSHGLRHHRCGARIRPGQV